MRSGFGDGPKNLPRSDAPGESAHAAMPIRAAHGALLEGSKASARPRNGARAFSASGRKVCIARSMPAAATRVAIPAVTAMLVGKAMLMGKAMLIAARR